MLTADSVGFWLFALITLVAGSVLLLRSKAPEVDGPGDPAAKGLAAVALKWLPILLVLFFPLMCSVLGFHAFLHPPHPEGWQVVTADTVRLLAPLDQLFLWMTLVYSVIVSGLWWWRLLNEFRASDERPRGGDEQHVEEDA